MTPHPPRSTLFPYTTLFRSIKGRAEIPPQCRDTSPKEFPPSSVNPPLSVEYSTIGRPSSERSRTAARNQTRSPCKSEEHTSKLQSPDHLVCRLMLEKIHAAY